MSYFEKMKREPWRFDFLDMMRRVERSLGERLDGDSVFAHPRPRIGDSATRRDEIVRLRAQEFAKEVAISFGQEAWMAFPGSTLREITPRWNKPLPRGETLVRDETPADRAHIVSAFLGLLGPQGPLPYHLTEEAHAFAQAEDRLLRPFPRSLQQSLHSIVLSRLGRFASHRAGRPAGI